MIQIEIVKNLGQDNESSMARQFADDTDTEVLKDTIEEMRNILDDTNKLPF